MKISRVMHRSEIDAFKKGKLVVPQRKTYIASCDNATEEFKELKNGCFFFAKGDARDYRFDELGQLFAMAGSANKVLAVFEIDENDVELFEGTATIHTAHGGEVEVPEIYIKAYSKNNANLLWVDWKWNFTCTYIESLEGVHGKYVSSLGEDYDDESCFKLSVPMRFEYPYKSRSKKIMDHTEAFYREKGGEEPQTLAIFREFMDF